MRRKRIMTAGSKIAQGHLSHRRHQTPPQSPQVEKCLEARMRTLGTNMARKRAPLNLNQAKERCLGNPLNQLIKCQTVATVISHSQRRDKRERKGRRKL